MIKSIKYLLLSLLVLALSLFATLYYVSSKLSSEDIKSFLVSKIEEAMPGTLVSIKEIRYSMGGNIRFEIQELDVKLRQIRPGRELLSVDKAFIRIPLWAILFEGGKIEIIILSPKINYYEYQDGPHNWTLGRKSNGLQGPGEKKTIKSQKERSNKGPDETIFLPVFLSKSKVSLKSKEITVFYQTKEDFKGDFTVNTFLLKNVSLNQSTDFEIHSAVKIEFPQKKAFSSNISLSGKFDTPNFLEKGLFEFSSDDIVIKDTTFSELPFPIPDTKATLFFSNKDNMVAKLKLNMGDLLDIKTNIFLGKTIQFNRLNANLNLLSALMISGVRTENLKLDDAKMNISGSVHLGNAPVLNLKFKTTHDVQYTLQKRPIDVGLLGKINKRQAEFNILLRTPYGRGSLAIKTVLPRDIRNTSLQHLSQTKILLKINQIKMAKEEIRRLLYSDTGQDDGSGTIPQSVPPKENQQVQEGRLFIPNFQLRLSGRKIAIGKSQFNFSGLVVAKENTLQSKDLSINIDRSKTEVHFTSKVSKNSLSTKIDLNMKKVPLESLDFIFPKDLEGMSGITTTRLTGNIVTGKKGLKHDLKLRLSTNNGKIPNLKIRNFLKGYLRKIPLLHKKVSMSDINISNKFKQFILKGRFRESHYRAEKLHFVGDKNRFQIKGRGHLFPLSKKKKGVFLLTFKINKPKVQRYLKRSIGADTIPIRLAGRGFVLKPDYSYTIKKIATSKAKTQGKRALKKKAKKILNKHLKKGVKKKAKKLLEGLLK